MQSLAGHQPGFVLRLAFHPCKVFARPLRDCEQALTARDLQALPQKDYSEKRSVIVDGREVTQTLVMRGVPLRALLEQAGLTPDDRHAVRRAYVLLTAQDGYQTVFSWGELFNTRQGEDVLVVLRHGDDDLLARDGLPSLRALQDLRSGPRHVRWLTVVDVRLPSP